MKYAEETGFKSKIEKFIQDDITLKGSFGPTYINAPPCPPLSPMPMPN